MADILNEDFLLIECLVIMYVFGTNSINKDMVIENYEINAMQREFFLQFMQVLIEDEVIVRKILIFIENLTWNFMKK